VGFQISQQLESIGVLFNSATNSNIKIFPSSSNVHFHPGQKENNLAKHSVHLAPSNSHQDGVRLQGDMARTGPRWGRSRSIHSVLFEVSYGLDYVQPTTCCPHRIDQLLRGRNQNQDQDQNDGCMSGQSICHFETLLFQKNHLSYLFITSCS
jgi:hypothetical protein